MMEVVMSNRRAKSSSQTNKTG